MPAPETLVVKLAPAQMPPLLLIILIGPAIVKSLATSIELERRYEYSLQVPAGKTRYPP